MTGEDYAATARARLDKAYHFTWGDGGDPVVGQALATEAVAYAVLALVDKLAARDEPVFRMKLTPELVESFAAAEEAMAEVIRRAGSTMTPSEVLAAVERGKRQAREGGVA